MTELTRFPDIEKTVRALLLRDLPDLAGDGKRVAVDWPAAAFTSWPFIRVEKTALGRRTRLNDLPVLDIEVLHTSRDAAKLLMEDVDTLLLGYPHSVDIGAEAPVVIDSVTVPITPSPRGWESSTVRRWAGSYRFSVRR